MVEPFKFKSSQILVELTGKKAATLEELLSLLKQMDDASVFYHVFHCLSLHGLVSWHKNDFAGWVDEALHDELLSSKLDSIDIRHYGSLREIKDELIKKVSDYVAIDEDKKKVPKGREFYLNRAIALIVPTKYEASSLEELGEALREIDEGSIAYHFIDARLRLKVTTNDFSAWVMNNFNDADLAERINKVDIYKYTIDGLRDEIVKVFVKKRIIREIK